MKANLEDIVMHLLPISYTIFLVGFFLFPSSKFLSNFYYLGVALILYGALTIVSHGNMLIHHPKPFWLFLWFPLSLIASTEMPNDLSHGHVEMVNEEARQVVL